MRAFELCDTVRFLRAKAVKQGNKNMQTSKTQALKMTPYRKEKIQKKKREFEKYYVCQGRRARKTLTY